MVLAGKLSEAAWRRGSPGDMLASIAELQAAVQKRALAVAALGEGLQETLLELLAAYDVITAVMDAEGADFETLLERLLLSPPMEQVAGAGAGERSFQCLLAVLKPPL